MKHIFFVLFFCLVIFGCKKHPFDYRNKFLGNYKFNVHKYDSEGGITTLDTTIYNGEITYGSDKNTIYITYSKNSHFETSLNEDGQLGMYSKSNIYGKFESTHHIIFRLEWKEMFGNYYIREVTGDRLK